MQALDPALGARIRLGGRVSSPEKKLVAGVEGEGWWRSERGGMEIFNTRFTKPRSLLIFGMYGMR